MILYNCDECGLVIDPKNIKTNKYNYKGTKYEVYACPRCRSEKLEIITFKEREEDNGEF